jgi:putative nucleotidyltransferase with HDIG domain
MSTPAASASADPGVEAPLRELHAERPAAPPRRRVVVEAASGVLFLAAAAALALGAGWHGHLDPLDAALLVAAYAIASRVEFDDGACYTVPTQLVFVPMLFVLPAPSVPLVVAAGIAAGHIPDYVRGRRHPARLVVVPGDAWHALPPAAILAFAGVDGFAWADWPLYAAAIAAQFGADLTTSTLRVWLGSGVSPGLQPRLAAWVYAIDVMLSCVGLLAAAAAAGQPHTWLLVMPLVGLIAIFARERERRIEAALELSQAYRGTAMLLGDVLEDADEYTGAHSRNVVRLSLEVAERIGLDARAKRNVEFAALLHDVGKMAIPAEIIHKPGPLTSDEWRVMRTHTLEGHRMLEQVGGVLAEVGAVVRASHERWDGRGYPDGLSGKQIPIESSIVCCCDAFDAMTTNRSYRPAMPAGEAVGELLGNAGTQFRPDVVDHVVAVVAGQGQVHTELAAVAA